MLKLELRSHIFEWLVPLREWAARQGPILKDGQLGSSSEQPLRGEMLTEDELESHGRLLAELYEIERVTKSSTVLKARLRENGQVLHRVYYQLMAAAKAKETLPTGAEWLLDNYHVVREQIKTISRNFNRSSFKELPRLTYGPYEGRPRVYALVEEYLTRTDSVVDPDLLTRLIAGFQRSSPLSIGELWAVPLMLRLALIENVRRLAHLGVVWKEERFNCTREIQDLIGADGLTPTEIQLKLGNYIAGNRTLLEHHAAEILKQLRLLGQKGELALQWLEEHLREVGRDPHEMIREEQRFFAANQVTMGNAISSFKAMATIRWKKWFEQLSVTEAILRKEESRVYARSDFETRNRCRTVLEGLARKLELDEVELADELLKLSRTRTQSRISTDGDDTEEWKSFFGYYLIDEGLPEFEKHIGFQPSVSLRFRRAVKKKAFFWYTSAIVALTGSLLAVLACYGLSVAASPLQIMIMLLLFLIPASDLAIHLVQWIVTQFVPPKILPKYDFEDGVPGNAQTVVAVHALFHGRAAVKRVVDGVRVRALGNRDESICFAILADLGGADKEELSQDRDVIEYAERLVWDLNETLGERFFLLFRKRVWSKSEQVFMGWERKRGKVMEFNQLITGSDETTFNINVGELSMLRECRYVITLDEDSQLPRGMAQKLIGTIAHPLNKAVFDPELRIVTRGYSVVQPLIGVSLTSAHASTFSQVYSMHSGLDPYSGLVSEVYQDLFDEASYVGKAIYDVEAFEKALDDRVPENALLSHDLFEGMFARVGLASDIELIDDIPSKYNVEVMRQHRWTRGDWQLLPWVLPFIPDNNRKLYRSPLSSLNRWKLIDNLRRSVSPISLILALALVWTWVPGSPLFWELFAVATVSLPILTGLVNAVLHPPFGYSFELYLRSVWRDLKKNILKALFSISFLPFYAYTMLHAIVITLYRMLISKRRLLEWKTAAISERTFGKGLSTFISQMYPGWLAALAAVTVCSVYKEGALLYALPFVALWILSPLIAYSISQPRQQQRHIPTKKEEDFLTEIAWETWSFFDDLLIPEYNYLMPDNLQLEPDRVVAERTSPTNISLSMLSTISAYDLGFIPITGSIDRVDKIFSGLTKLERFNGHFFNWYDIKDLRPLPPRYVSFVDSGNLVGHLIAVRQAARDFYHLPVLHERFTRHLAVRLKAFDRELEGVEGYSELVVLLKDKQRSLGDCANILKIVEKLLVQLGDQDSSELLEKLAVELGELSELGELWRWSSTIQEAEDSLSVLSSSLEDKDSKELKRLLSGVTKVVNGRRPSLSLILKLNHRIGELIERWAEVSTDAQEANRFNQLIDRLKEEQKISIGSLEALTQRIEHIIDCCSGIIAQIDFRFLYDKPRRLFYIGYNLDEARMDSGHYDLLASEARLGSFVAIATGQVSEKHWFRLGRSITDSVGGKTLISWSGTMFEYLMPDIVMGSFPNSILAVSCDAAVRAQRAYGERRGVPWGVSESGYSGVDFHSTYQYRAFGVPGLGLKRGLTEDLVISPYSTFLALSTDPTESLKNLHALDLEGGRGEYGYFESIDYTSDRLSEGEDKHVVKSFLCHHQGMSIVAVNNYLNSGIFQERFHDEPIVQATELLLHEKFPERVIPLVHHHAELSLMEDGELPSFRSEKLFTPHTAQPRTWVLSNGNYSVLIDNAGSGHSFFDEKNSVNRWREDQLCNNYGKYIFVKDRDSGKVWSTTYQPTRVEADSYEVIYSPDKVEFRRSDSGIRLRTQVTVSPEDDVEVRKVLVTNLSNQKRSLELSSFFEVVLGSRAADLAHPAFAKMSIETEFLSDYDALIASRRPRSHDDDPLYLFHMLTMQVCWEKVSYESSRLDFIGRGRTLRNAEALTRDCDLTNTVGRVLDPVCSLRTRLELEPGESVELAFITGVTKDRDDLLHLVQRYHTLHGVNRAFEMSWSQSNVELRHELFTLSQVYTFQKLANCLFFNLPEMRGDQSAIRGNRLQQSGFWRFSISGDVPIVLARVADPGHRPFIVELLRAYAYLRWRGIVFDLVLLNEYPGGYFQDFLEQLESMVRAGPWSSHVEKQTGIFVRSLQQLSEEEVSLLHAEARIVLNGAKGPLEKQLKVSGSSPEPPSPSGLFSYLRDTESVLPFMPPQSKLEFDNEIGGFSNSGSEYVMRVSGDSLPPMPWSNVVANDHFGFLVSEQGGGYTWSDNSRENRLTPWSNDPVSDQPGEVIYLRDVDTGAYWSATPQPASTTHTFSVTHGFGFSRFSSQIRGIYSSLKISCDMEEKVKWFRLDLFNGDYFARNLELFFYVDWTVGIIREQSFRHHVVDYDAQSGQLYVVNHYNNEFAGRCVFMGATARSDYTGSRREFIGRNCDLSSPFLLEQGIYSSLANLVVGNKGIRLSKALESGGDSCGVLKVNVPLEPRQDYSLGFYLGEAPTVDEMRVRAKRYRTLDTCSDSIERTEAFWSDVTGEIEVKTPNRSLDVILNGWLPYQNLSCRIKGRTGFYQSGGAFGFRDQLQDSMAHLYTRPEIAREQLLLHASRQFMDGDVQHWWHPPTGRGVRTRISDDYLWLPYVLLRYLEVTGDRDILEEKVPFIEGRLLESHEMEAYIVPHTSEHTATMYEHCVIALDRALKFGPHGLPLIGAGDWNDGMNEVGIEGKGESVWLGWFLYDILQRFVPLVEEQKDKYRGKQYRDAAETLLAAIEKNGWDGEWYRRAFFDDGTPLGSVSSEECKIDSLAQSWSIITGGGQAERCNQAMDNVYEKLVREKEGIICLLSPPFDKSSKYPGYIQGYLPGVRENGGQYTHAAVWVIWATTMLGRGAKAVELFDMINPINHTDDKTGANKYQCEPYVTCGDVYSSPPHTGRAGWSWYSGSGGWLYRVGIEQILGLQVFNDGFEVKPCVPEDWGEFSVRYKRNGTLYNIDVKNPAEVSTGVTEVRVEGESIEGNRVLFDSDHGGKRNISVQVTMGASD